MRDMWQNKLLDLFFLNQVIYHPNFELKVMVINTWIRLHALLSSHLITITSDLVFHSSQSKRLSVHHFQICNII